MLVEIAYAPDRRLASVPAFARGGIRVTSNIRRKLFEHRAAVLHSCLMALALFGSMAAMAQAAPATLYPVGMTQLESVAPAEGGRPLDLMLIYPAAPPAGALPVKIPLAA